MLKEHNNDALEQTRINPAVVDLGDEQELKMMIIMVRDGMGWFTRWGLISYLLVDYGWSVGQKIVVAISNLSYVVSGSLLALIPNFIQIGQKTQKSEIRVVWFWSVGLVGRKKVVAISNSFYVVFAQY